MDAFFFRNRLSALLDDELEPAERREMEAAIAADPELARVWTRFRDGVSVIRREGAVRPPDGMAAELVSLPPARRAPWWAVGLGVGAIGAILAIGLVNLPSRDPAPAGPAEAADAGAADAAEGAPVEGAPTEGAPAEGEPELTHDDVAPGETLPDEILVGVEPIAGTVSDPSPEELARVDRSTPPPEDDAPAPGSLTPEGAAALARRPRASGAAPTIRVNGRTVTVEREPYLAPWEKEEEPAPAPSTAPGDYRLRVLATRDTVLQELAVLTRAVGGELNTPGGAPLAPYPMDPGDSRLVHVRLPTTALAAFVQNLPALGVVEALATPPAPASGSATVRIEVQQP